jgi:tellurite resistance protein
MNEDISKEQLYDAFGELLYAVASIDGEVQYEEAKKIEELLTGHEGAEEMMWSFEYEYRNKNTVKEASERALIVCKAYGSCPDYPFLINALQKTAEASSGIQAEEQSLLDQFAKELEALNA